LSLLAVGSFDVVRKNGESVVGLTTVRQISIAAGYELDLSDGDTCADVTVALTVPVIAAVMRLAAVDRSLSPCALVQRRLAKNP